MSKGKVSLKIIDVFVKFVINISPYLECGGSGEKGSLGTSLGSSMMPRHTIARQRTIEEFVSKKFDDNLGFQKKRK